MTTSLELQSPKVDIANGDEALEIVNRHRADVEDHFRVDPLEVELPTLSYRIGRRGIYLAEAADNLAGAFKWRGALVGATKLQEQGYDSLVVPSAGNHARGAILAARILGMSIHVVVPKTAPPAKKEGLKDLWDDQNLNIHAVGQTFDEAYDWAIMNGHLGALLHPYDDPNVLAGQGTLVDDTLAALDDPSRLRHYVVSSGGFGGPSGALKRFQELGRHDVIVHAVEADGSNSLSKSIDKNEVTDADSPNARFGGSAVLRIGEHGFHIYQDNPNNLKPIGVSDAEVDHVTHEYELDRKDLLREDTPNYEPTTLKAMAALPKIALKYTHGDIVVVGTGHNAPLWQQQPSFISFNHSIR